LDVTLDPSRLCETCGWFGDRQETLPVPPKSNEFNPVLAAAQTLDLYRDVCRKELIAEQMYDNGSATQPELRKVRVLHRQAVRALIEMFVNLHQRKASRQ